VFVAMMLMAQLLDYRGINTGSAFHLDRGVTDVKTLRQEVFKLMENTDPPFFAVTVNINMH
jgi:hypothetical protein